MECLQWLVDGKVPKPEELQAVHNQVLLHLAIIAKVRIFPRAIGLALLFRTLFLIEAVEEGLRRVREAFEKAIKEDPMLALFFSILNVIDEQKK